MSTEDIIKAIKEMSVLELADMVKTLESELGVSAAAPVAVAAPSGDAGAGTAAAADEEEKVDFSVLIQDIGANKINVIKAVREVTSLGLREAKELVESAPAVVKESVNKDEADQIKEKMEAAGATVAVQ